MCEANLSTHCASILSVLTRAWGYRMKSFLKRRLTGTYLASLFPPRRMNLRQLTQTMKTKRTPRFILRQNSTKYGRQRESVPGVSEMFRRAKRSVLIAGYRVYDGDQIFETLSERMEEVPDLEVTMCLDIRRDNNDTTDAYMLKSKHVARFKNSQWPQCKRLPKVYFDPRSLSLEYSKRASLHAKCIVIDESECFISSANFTKRGQERNIEVGVQLFSVNTSASLSQHFRKLIETKLLEQVI